MIDFFKITPKKRSVKIGKKYGILYNNPPKSKRIIFYIGNIVLILSVVYLTYLYQPLVGSLIKYNFKTKKNKNEVLTEEEIKVESEDSFSIFIPKISAKSDIIENISPYNKEEYSKVIDQNKIAHSKTSSLPGKGKNKMTFLFAHSTQQDLSMVRKNSIFYLLDELINGDVVYVNYMGEFYKYRVYDKKVVSDKEIEYLKFKDPEREILILQTCWPIGTNWKRLLVFVERI